MPKLAAAAKPLGLAAAAKPPGLAAAAKPLTAAEFGRLIAPLAGQASHLAVACSGGADSLCLALLAAGWARAKRRKLTALIVDHRLRKESTAEARRVRGWLQAAGIEAEILTRQGAKPKANIQEAARQARYALLEDWCARHGVRHLLLAQHRDDQAETFILRAARGSGADGLAAMQPVNGLRLRPLLEVPKSRLVATLRARGQAWIEDPGNANPAYARTAARAALALLGDDAAGHIAATARNMARLRQALEDLTAAHLRRCVAFDPKLGLAWADAADLTRAPDEIALRALAALLKAVGGEALPPRLDSLERLLAALKGGRLSHTLHRCRLLEEQGRLLIAREARHLPAPIRLKPGEDFAWDGRFRVRTPARLPAGLTLAPLGSLPFRAEIPAAIPAGAKPGLPALCKSGKVIGLPSLDLGMSHGVAIAASAAFSGSRKL